MTPNIEPQTPSVKHGGARPGAGRKREVVTPFSAWAAGRGLESKDLAKLLGISKAMANHLLAERSRPGLDTAAKIEELSNGLFPASYWTKIPKKTLS